MHQGIVHTFWLLKVSTTLSAPSFVSKIISAITFGRSAIKRHPKTTPPIGVIALSISAAVVPIAKFFAITVKGPASPRIEIPGFDVPIMLNCPAEGEPLTVACRRSLRIPRRPRGPRGICALLFEAAGLFNE